jgi:DNA-directed RNA polymerase subunit L
MEFEILNESKEEIEFKVGSLTIAELLRVYLNENENVTFAAWKREHPTEQPIMKVKSKGKDVKKLIKDAAEEITKELDKFKTDFKKLK